MLFPSTENRLHTRGRYGGAGQPPLLVPRKYWYGVCFESLGRCEHCKQLAPEYIKAAADLKKDGLPLGKVKWGPPYISIMSQFWLFDTASGTKSRTFLAEGEMVAYASLLRWANFPSTIHGDCQALVLWKGDAMLVAMSPLIILYPIILIWSEFCWKFCCEFAVHEFSSIPIESSTHNFCLHTEISRKYFWRRNGWENFIWAHFVFGKYQILRQQQNRPKFHQLLHIHKNPSIPIETRQFQISGCTLISLQNNFDSKWSRSGPLKALFFFWIKQILQKQQNRKFKIPQNVQAKIMGLERYSWI